MADGQNVIGAFTLGACKAVRIAESHKAVKFYGLRHSPSCDPRTGITAQMLRKRGIVCHFG